MKAIIVNEFRDPPPFELIERDDPVPGPGELRIRVHSAAVNFGDTLIASGRYQVRPNLPFVPGTECAGIVDAVGAGVTDYRVGDRVAASGFVGDPRTERRIIGTFAEAAIAPLANVVPVHPALSLEDAVLLRSSIETAFEALYQGRLARGETLLVLGAAGGTGFAAVQLGKWLGAHVIASASTEEKRAIAASGGADATIDSNDPDWRQRVADLTGGRGPDVIFDPVGGIYTEPAFRSLGWGGRLLVVGFAAGTIPAIPINLALLKGTSIIGINILQASKFEPDRMAADRRRLYDLCGTGLLKPVPVSRRFPLAEAGEALAEVASGKRAGRVVVTLEQEAIS